MIDVQKIRAACEFAMAENYSALALLYPVGANLFTDMVALLDERKPAPCRFDTAAAREELARIDAAWASTDETTSRFYAHHATRVLLDKALSAIDAGWSEPGEDVVERASIAAFESARGVFSNGEWTTWNEGTCNVWRKFIRAALMSAGRLPEPAGDVVARGADAGFAAAGNTGHLAQNSGGSDHWRKIARAVLASAGRLPAPMAITDAMVEKAARLAFNDVPVPGRAGHSCKWDATDRSIREDYRRVARVVLEYAASLQPATSDVARDRDLAREHMEAVSDMLGAKGTECLYDTAGRVLKELRGEAERLRAEVATLRAVAPAVDPREERLTRYRCAAPAFIGSDHDMSPADIAVIVEKYAHAMLAAEKAPGAA